MASKHVVLGDPEDISEKVEKLKNTVKNEGQDYPTDDERMLRSLRCSQFIVEDAFKQTKALNEMKKQFPDMLSGFDSDEFQTLLQEKTGAKCPVKSEDLTGILFFKMGDWNPDEIDFQRYSKMIMYGVLLVANDVDVQRNGISIIYDLSGLTLKHVRAIEFRFAKLVTFFYQYCAPCPFKKVFIVNENWVYSFLFALCRLVGGSVFIDRIQAFGRNCQMLKEIIGGQCLPKEYGGDWDVEYFSYEEVVV